MGRDLLLMGGKALPAPLVAVLLLVAALAGCAPEAAPRAARATDDPHGTLACTQCHQGGLADAGEAAVPDEACTGSGCHETDVPDQVTLATVRFQHRDHGADQPPAMGCAGCHTHEQGSGSLRAGPETCGLCHQDELSSSRGEDCRLCHASPTHEGTTSQNLAIPHEGLPWIEGGCLRCHYEVARPVHEVSLDRCAQCHADVQDVTTAGIGEDLHPEHVGNACVSCHEGDNHHIEAMSSSVDLVCADCHEDVHGTDSGDAGLEPSTCSTCHRTTHQAPQRLLLGVPPVGEAAFPSDHFMEGLTCRSCHIPGGPEEDGALTGTGAACVACHRPEYATVLGWWNQGLEQRSRLVDGYLTTAESRVAGDSTSVASLSDARTLLGLVEQAGGAHNLPLSHRLFQEALDLGSDAYRQAGLMPPPTPTLGRPPRQGLCSYCHYRVDEPGLSDEMSDEFHRDVMGVEN
jgi:hypothetical protein